MKIKNYFVRRKLIKQVNSEMELIEKLSNIIQFECALHINEKSDEVREEYINWYNTLNEFISTKKDILEIIVLPTLKSKLPIGSVLREDLKLSILQMTATVDIIFDIDIQKCNIGKVKDVKEKIKFGTLQQKFILLKHNVFDTLDKARIAGHYHELSGLVKTWESVFNKSYELIEQEDSSLDNCINDYKQLYRLTNNMINLINNKCDGKLNTIDNIYKTHIKMTSLQGLY